MMIGYASTGIMGLADYAAAESRLAAALEIAERADLQWHRGPILLGLDHVAACRGRYGEAYGGMTRNLAWLESLAQVRYALMAYLFLAELLLDVGRNREAAEHIQRALALGSAASITFWRPRMEADLAIARMRLGALDAGPALEREAAQCRTQRELYQLTRCIEGLAELALARGDALECMRHAEDLLALAEAQSLDELAGTAHRWRGEALAAQGERAGALAELRIAGRTARRIGRVRHVYDVERALAKLGEKHEAEHWADAIRAGAADGGLEAGL
jgi:tetratricopeptide (TPR) repeat protein